MPGGAERRTFSARRRGSSGIPTHRSVRAPCAPRSGSRPCHRWRARRCDARRQWRPTRRATAPTRRCDKAPESVASCQGPSSICTSTLSISRVGAQATPAIGVLRPAGQVGARAGHVDPRLRLDRPFLRPAPRDPVAVEGLPRRQLDLAEPLRRRHVAVEAGDDEPRREAVVAQAAARRSSRSRPCTRRRPRAPRVGKPAVNPSTERPTICVASSCAPARSRSAASGTPCHTRVADEVAADLVRHARAASRLPRSVGMASSSSS